MALSNFNVKLELLCNYLLLFRSVWYDLISKVWFEIEIFFSNLNEYNHFLNME